MMIGWYGSGDRVAIVPRAERVFLDADWWMMMSLFSTVIGCLKPVSCYKRNVSRYLFTLVVTMAQAQLDE